MANIVASFSEMMDQSTNTSSNFVVNQNFTGNISDDGARFQGSLIFDPDNDFKPGAQVEVTLTSGIQNAAGASIPSFVWRFIAAAGAGGDLSTLGTVGNANDFANTVKFGDMNGDGNLDLVLVPVDC